MFKKTYNLQKTPNITNLQLIFEQHLFEVVSGRENLTDFLRQLTVFWVFAKSIFIHLDRIVRLKKIAQ